MAEEAKVTPGTEKIVPKEGEAPKEGTLEAEIAKGTPEQSKTKEPDVVPLGTYLSLKDDIKELKRELKEAKDSAKPAVIVSGLRDLAEKYPDVDKNFINDILSAATSQAQNEIEKKYTPIIERQDNEKKELAFNKAFDNLFEKTLNDNPELPKSIDKETIKALALTPKYRNVPLKDILFKMYPVANEGKSSSENEVRTAADRVDDIVTFDKITADQKKAVMQDPASRKKYFDWLDSQNR